MPSCSLVLQKPNRSPLETAEPRMKIPQNIGPYEILQPLGQGGMGVVYAARHPETSEIFALKTVVHLQRSAVQAIRREIDALARVRHPGVVPIVSQGVEDGVPWYAMKWLQGQTLRHFARHELWKIPVPGQPVVGESTSAPPSTRHWSDGGWWTEKVASYLLAPDLPRDRATEWDISTARLAEESLEAAFSGDESESLWPRSAAENRPAAAGGDLERALTLIAELCGPLAFLHGEGIVHRDIKPENILVGKDGLPIILDFGLVALAGRQPGRETLDLDAGAFGTILYCAPEQIRGESVDARADLYSIGCILYELLTGHLPFRADSAAELARMHLEARPTPPSALVDGIAPELDTLVVKLLAKQPRARLGYADDLAVALRRLGAAQISRPGPPSRSYLYHPGFSGREAELGWVKRQLNNLFAGKGTLVFLTGESGIGKTRLASEIARLARDMGVFVLAGDCYPQPSAGDTSFTLPGRGTPFHAFRKPLQTIADHCRELGGAEAERILGRRGKVLSMYEPSLGILAGQGLHPDPAKLPAAEARARLFADLTETLTALSKRHPLLLILDDLHWADELTLGCLQFIVRSEVLAKTPLLIVGTHLEGEARSGLRRLLEEPKLVHWTLPRLDLSSITQMVIDMLAIPRPPAAFIRFLHRQSEGNPRFLSEYLRSALAEGLLYRDPDGRWRVLELGEIEDDAAFYQAIPLPHALRDLLERQLRRLPPNAKSVASILATIGREADLDLLNQTTDLTEMEMLHAVDQLVRMQILELGSLDALRFVHDKIRDVLYHQMAAEQRRGLHQKVAKAMEGLGEEFLAPAGSHWREAGEIDKAQDCFLAGARYAGARYVHGDAEQLYEAYLGLVPQWTKCSVKARNELATKVLLVQGRLEEAAAQHDWAHEEARAIQWQEGQRESLYGVARIRLLQGRLRQALRLFEELITLFRNAGDGGGEARAMTFLALCHWKGGELEVARRLSEKAFRLHRAEGNSDLMGRVLNNLAGFHRFLGQLAKAKIACERALALFREVGNRQAVAATLGNLASVYAGQGKAEKARRFFRLALDHHRETGDRLGEPQTLLQMAVFERRRGCLEESDLLLQRAHGLARTVGLELLEAICFCELGHLELAKGRPARKLLRLASELTCRKKLAPESEVEDALRRLRRSIDTFDAGGVIFRGEAVDEIPNLPESLRHWLFNVGHLGAS